MSLDVVKDIDLSQYLRKAKFIYNAIEFNSNYKKFIEIIKDFIVNITKVNVLINIYVINILDLIYYFILSRPF